MKQRTYGYLFHKDGTIKGEKKHLSYSAIDLWKKNKPEYRERYYKHKPSIVTPYTIFGTQVHKDIEEGNLTVTELDVSPFSHEVRKEGFIGDVVVVAYIDLLNEDTLQVVDIKTSINAWDSVMVHKLDQLPLYSLLLRNELGKFNKYTGVLWLETEWKEKDVEKKNVRGFSMDVGGEKYLALTGKQVYLPRRLYKYELDELEQEVIRVADEIDADFTQWKLENNPF